jgi:hypothetical protein
MAVTPVSPPAYPRGRRAGMIALAGAVPVLLALTGAVVMLTWLPDLPEPIAMHWGSAGVDGYGTVGGLVALLISLVVVFSAIAVGGILAARAAPVASRRPSLPASMAVALACVLSIGIPGSLWLQRGLATAADAPSPHWFVIAGAAVGIVAGAAVYLRAPAADVVPVDGIDEIDEPAPDIRLGETERVVWSGAASATRWLVTGLGASVVLLVAVAIAAAAAGDSAIPFIAPVVVLIVLGVTLFWRVRVDARGVTVRSAIGWPRFAVPMGDIDTAAPVNVNPLTDFGGWGLRWGAGGRFGVVLRGGEALEITRLGGRSFVVTVARASEAAAVVNGLVARERARS